jgi:hypothetical protein
MIEKTTFLLSALLLVSTIKCSEIQNLKFWTGLLPQKAELLSLFFDSHKTVFTQIYLVPFRIKTYYYDPS